MSYHNIAFTICSNNYLGQALALKKSFLKHNPDFGFYVVLVDERSSLVDYSLFEPGVILPISEIETLDVPDLIARYYIIELNTSVKPTAFKHLIKENPQAQNFYYLDPDLYFYDSLAATNTLLDTHTAVLTPHILSPIPRDGMLPDENIFLRFGIYNLGFLGINGKNQTTLKLLDWWEERVIKYGYDRPTQGYFVDQLWMAQAPLFYKDIYVLKTYNYNMAPWNLHERKVESVAGDVVMLNDNSRLCFYHYSKISTNEMDVSREYDRYSLRDLPLLKSLYDDYKKQLLECHFYEYKKIPIAYPVKMNLKPAPVKRSFLSNVFRKFGNIAHKMAEKM